jgi:lipoyl(octanoyl) transferase
MPIKFYEVKGLGRGHVNRIKKVVQGKNPESRIRMCYKCRWPAPILYFSRMNIPARIINDSPHTAAFNMAADLRLLSVCESAPGIFIRLYTWDKPSITLGTMEKPHETLNREVMEKHSAEWIRRATGGRSVLHDHEITYSCIFSNGAPGMGATLMETYRVIADCLIAGLTSAGIKCSQHDSSLDTSLLKSGAKLPCFLAPNRHEIMASGKKLVGSAQKRTANAVLQHGSIPLTPAFRDLPDYLHIDEKEREIQKRLLAQKCTCISEIVPAVSESYISECLIRGFRETLSCEATESPWTPEEISAIETIATSDEFKKKWQA